MDRRAVPKSGESLHQTNPLKRVTNPEYWRTNEERMRNEWSKNSTIKGTYAIRLRDSRFGGEESLWGARACLFERRLGHLAALGFALARNRVAISSRRPLNIFIVELLQAVITNGQESR